MLFMNTTSVLALFHAVGFFKIFVSRDCQCHHYKTLFKMCLSLTYSKGKINSKIQSTSSSIKIYSRRKYTFFRPPCTYDIDKSMLYYPSGKTHPYSIMTVTFILLTLWHIDSDHTFCTSSNHPLMDRQTFR